jgi:hypothetical protein
VCACAFIVSGLCACHLPLLATFPDCIFIFHTMQQRRPSHRPPRQRVLRKYSTSFSTIDWGFRPSIVAAIKGGDDSSCEGIGGTPQTGGGQETERSTIVSVDSSSSDTNKKRNHLRKVFNSFKGIFAHREESSLSIHDDKSSTDKKPNATGEDEQQQPLQQRKSSAATASSAAAAAALVRHLPSSQLDESEISVDDEGFLHWDHTKRTFTQCPENK